MNFLSDSKSLGGFCGVVGEVESLTYSAIFDKTVFQSCTTLCKTHVIQKCPVFCETHVLQGGWSLGVKICPWSSCQFCEK